MCPLGPFIVNSTLEFDPCFKKGSMYNLLVKFITHNLLVGLSTSSVTSCLGLGTMDLTHDTVFDIGPLDRLWFVYLIYNFFILQDGTTWHLRPRRGYLVTNT